MTGVGSSKLALTCVYDDVDEVHAFGEGVSQVDMVEADDAALPFRPFQGLSSFQRLFASHLIFVELGEVVHDNWNGQRDYQHATNATDTAYHFSQWGGGVDIPVAHSCHRDPRPPERLRDTDELGVWFLFFRKIGQTRKNKYAHSEEEHK